MNTETETETKSKSYRVTWEIDEIEAASPAAAAREALNYITEGSATVFMVQPCDSDSDSDSDSVFEVDLYNLSETSELTIEDWREDVRQGDTKLGFEDWKAHQQQEDLAKLPEFKAVEYWLNIYKNTKTDQQHLGQIYLSREEAVAAISPISSNVRFIRTQHLRGVYKP